MILNYLLLILISITAVSCKKPREEVPTVMVVFGATGDLTAKKILPAIDRLSQERLLPENFAVIGVARKTEEEFRKQIVSAHPLYYHQTSFEEDLGYESLSNLLNSIDRDFGAKSNKIYYLAVQPNYFSTIVAKLSSHNLISKPGQKEWTRIMIEKPFGHDLESALRLQETLSQFLDESQIYRIDHYLAKEGVQNFIDFRLKGELEPLWNRHHIDRIQITLSEEIGIGSRGHFFEEEGLLRDIVQNHIMQLLSLVAMDVGDDPSAEKIKVLTEIRPIETIVRGQYGPGAIHGENVAGYKQEKDVPPSSTVETFAAARLFIDNDRWKDIPFDIRSGKRLASQLAEITITFKSKETLHIRIQPKPAIFFEGASPMIFESFPFSEAYQKLIYDCIRGDQTAFVQREESFAAWRILAPVLDAEDPPLIYQAGTNGPEGII